MNKVLEIRKRLDMSQREFGAEICCTQGNVSHYEARGQRVPVDVAKSIIELAKTRGVQLSLDDIYASS